jgi:hypothetical protein
MKLTFAAICVLLSSLCGCAGVGHHTNAQAPAQGQLMSPPPSEDRASLGHRLDLCAGRVRDTVVQVPARTQAVLETAASTDVVACVVPPVYVAAFVLACIMGHAPAVAMP